MSLKLKHLTEDQHDQAAKLITEIQERIRALEEIVLRAPFTDRGLNLSSHLQERIANPLADAYEELCHALRKHADERYYRVGYAKGRR